MGLKLEVGKYYRDANGEKKGPMRKDPEFSDIWDQGDDNRQDDYHWFGDGKVGGGAFKAVDLIAEWPADDAPTGPVRTVTRTTKEIVPGVYGAVSVHQITDSADAGHVWITLTSKEATPEQTLHALLKADQIRAASATLTEIADALEDQ